jgi:hypothetical protein
MQDPRRSHAHTRGFGRSRCEVPVRILWILCAGFHATENKGFRLITEAWREDGSGTCIDDRAEVLYISSRRDAFRDPREPGPVNEVFPVVPP